ncbi:MAG TPA: hypothetical protein VGM76_19140 [Lacipirellulaceae bacterium]|jgi:hypothetical protein
MRAKTILDAEFLPLRAKLLEMAAALDRLDCAEGQLDDDPRMTRVREAMKILLQQDGDRAELMQMAFSRAYDENWPTRFGLTL